MTRLVAVYTCCCILICIFLIADIILARKHVTVVQQGSLQGLLWQEPERPVDMHSVQRGRFVDAMLAIRERTRFTGIPRSFYVGSNNLTKKFFIAQMASP
jgi:hypothetical protein